MHRKGPAHDTGTVSPPDFIVGDAVALAFWNEHTPQLVAGKRLRPEHAATFGVVCQVASECQALAERVAREGAVLNTGRGTRANPACRLLRDARRDLFAFARDFGLTIMSDARLPAEHVEEPPNELDEFLTWK
jgi:phage terminase small subunit